MKILLGDISSYKAIVVAKYIKKKYPDITIITFDTKKFTKFLHSKYSDEHLLIEDYNIERISNLILNRNIQFFFPVINSELSSFWKDKSLLHGSLDYLGEYSTYQILNDKLKLHKLASELGVLVPDRFDSIECARIPYIIKPTNLSSSKGVIYVMDKTKVQKISSKNDLIIQQFVSGVGVGFSFYSQNGKILNCYGHKRLAEYPIAGGSSTYRSGYNDKRMFEAASKIVGRLKYTGFAMFEFKLTKKGELFLLEVNPRIWGSINQGMVNGVNYFENIFPITPVKSVKHKKEVFTFLGPLIYISLIGYLFRFQFKPIITFIRKGFNNYPDINILKDPQGYLSTILRKISR